ncbi:MAG: discoidin domain-containing protein [Chitinophaga sp.]|uniref:glycoside hydrolase family 2 TIM barrel-domain containing protein n=1 Tax=Chitinophaga sp. TaxID=1869181 RepID=UPI001B1C6408|nr:glycoside hydrolase family 2 TIM barrel-domain containing protein [Chitinophaga sp.]MBO9729665.1 discoidin domain-containing protein [Chitinophaga sp.]
MPLLKFRGLIILLLVHISLPSQLAAQSRDVLNLNTNWAFHRGDVTGAEKKTFNDKDWSGISIPHVMRIEKKHNGGNQVYQGVGWYRRYFRLPAAYHDKRITLCFDGVQTTAEVYLNGQRLTTHTGGYIGFVVDITPYIILGEDNVLAVRVTNTDNAQIPPGKPQANLDFNYFGGIYRNVTLLATEKIFISHPLEANKVAGGGVFITYPAADSNTAAAHIKTNIVNAGNQPTDILLKTTLVDSNGIVVATAGSQQHMNAHTDKDIEQSLTIHHPQLWHPDHPYLYRLVSVVYHHHTCADSLITATGIRNIAFRPDGFYINGEKLYLRGANRHQAYEYIGDAAPDNMQYMDALQLKKGGFNAVRAAHYPQSPAFLDACDKTGLLVIECEPGWQFFSKDALFTANTYRDIREMIRRDRNHPSVFLWETSLNESPTPESWMQQAVQTAQAEMPGQQLFVADDYNARSKNHYNVSYKVVNEDGSDPMPSRPFLTREWGDSWMADAEKESGLRASRIYTEKGLINQCIFRQNALNGETSEELGGYWDHGGLDANPRIGGYFVWSYNDYTRGSDAVTAFSGVVDLDRYEKFSYYQLQAMQDARNPVYGPMVYIGSYNNQPALDSNIIVFSNCDAVQLYRNDQLCGEITRAQNAASAPFVAAKGGSPYFTFHTGKYEAGMLKAVGLLNGKAVCTHTVRTPDRRPHHLEIEIPANHTTFLADGSSMTPFYVKVCDKNGTLISNSKPGESFFMRVRVSGEGTLIGGQMSAPNVSILYTEGGIAYGLIQHTTTPGEISISATVLDKGTGHLTFKTKASSTKYVPDGTHHSWLHENKTAPMEHNTDTSTLPLIDLRDAAVAVQPGPGKESPLRMTDENTTTKWTADAGKLPLSITLDLKKTYTLAGSRIVWGKDSDWYTYSISVSANGSDWVEVKSAERVSGQDYKVVLLQAPSARYVRYTISGIQPESSRIAIKEILVYGK